MTIEDVPDSTQEQVALLGRYRLPFPETGRTITFSVAAAPMPSDCEFSFFDPNDEACQEILFDPNTSISELFAILRQWVPQVQQNIDIIGNEILRRGCNVNDRDGLTDMTLLHYACKSGANGIGDADNAAKYASQLIELGADINLRSRWTNMNALHYAAYFDVPELISVILKVAKPRDVDATSSDFDFGTALHIAANNLCINAVKSLLEHGANPAFRNDKGQIPADVVPDPVDMPLEMADAAATAKELKQMLLGALPMACDISKTLLQNYDHVSGKDMLLSVGLNLGDRVVIAGQKVGTLRFCGPTEFASGQWAGIEMDEPEGKNNGCVGGVQYFKCPPQHGIGVSVKKGSEPTKIISTEEMEPMKNVKQAFFPGSSCSSSSTSSLENKQYPHNHLQGPSCTTKDKKTGFKPLAPLLRTTTGLQTQAPPVVNIHPEAVVARIGSRVLVVGQRMGTVRFYGETSFAPGFWYGIELDKPHGKNDGSVGGVQYFTCAPKHGIFAPPSRVQRISGSLDSLTEIPEKKLNHSFPGFRRSFSTTSASPSQKEISRRNSFGKSKNPSLRHSWSSTATTSAEGNVKLHEGSQVLLTSSSEMAIIRYIGLTDFAQGVWLGLELRSAKGKNDGSVGDKRYFQCKQNYGVLVRPSRVTYRGINGSKLVNEIF
ncbi:CAP-Gly domain-containing linker protein 4 isoform X2 [Ambystoma mexicanum]|uniref:CAP-Gly domain-containing linker protein 4 isoform X2 n=1 Tax=Ambystoma mexicanum TaxID=8296 RepID=UPI0037E78721